METVVVKVVPKKSIRISGIEVEFQGKTFQADGLALHGAGKHGRVDGDIVRVPLLFYETNKDFISLVIAEAPIVSAPQSTEPEPEGVPELEPTKEEAAPTEPKPVDPKRESLENTNYAALKDLARVAKIEFKGNPKAAWLIDKLMEQG